MNRALLQRERTKKSSSRRCSTDTAMERRSIIHLRNSISGKQLLCQRRKNRFEQLEISFWDLYHSNRLEGLKPHFSNLLLKFYEQDQPLLEAEKALGSAIAPTAAMDSDLPAEREQGSRFMKIASFAFQAVASIGSSDCSLEPLSLPLSFARKGKAAVLSPATDECFAKLCLFQKDEADLIPGATYNANVAVLSTKAKKAVAALRGGSSAAQVDKGDGAITFVLDIFDSEGERLQRQLELLSSQGVV